MLPSTTTQELPDLNLPTSSSLPMATTAESCQFLSCHGYSHTLQYFPQCSPISDDKVKVSVGQGEVSFPYIPDFIGNENGGGHQVQKDKYNEPLDMDGKRKKSGQQKRSWNTENYQWMNIKRTRKTPRFEGKFKLFTGLCA